MTARATSSLPVPLSPRISTVTSVSAIRSIRSCTSAIRSLWPMIGLLRSFRLQLVA